MPNSTIQIQISISPVIEGQNANGNLDESNSDESIMNQSMSGGIGHTR
jgi:hypothetical protein